MRVLLLGSYAPSIVSFRGPLIRRMVQAGHEVVVAAPGIDESLCARLAELGASARSVDVPRTGMNPLSDLAYYRRLKQAMREIRPNALVAYTAKPVIWGALAAKAVGIPHRAAMITGIGYAFTEGDELRRRVARGAAGLLYRTALRTCHRVAFQNRDDRDFFLTTGLLKDGPHVSVVNGSGVDLVHYAEAPLSSAPNFLMVGRLLVSKGLREFAEAAIELKRRYPAAVFRVAGWHDESPDAVAQADLDRWKAAGVEFLGSVSDIRAPMAEANVFVLPSYREGTPRSGLEAMAMGRPIVTTDVPGCRETVRDGVNGLLVPARDSARLAAAMARFIEEPQLIASMGARSRQMVAERYGAEKVAEETLIAVGLA